MERDEQLVLKNESKKCDSDFAGNKLAFDEVERTLLRW